MPISEVQQRAHTWSKCTLIGSVLLFVYSALTLGVSVHMDREWHRRHPEVGMSRDHHGHPHHPHGFEGEGPMRLHHFAVLGLLTAVTGMVSTFNMKRRWAFAFLVLVLLTEVSALGFVGYKNAKAVQHCSAMATDTTLLVRDTTLKITNNVEFHRREVVGAAFTLDKPKLEECTNNVKHASVLGCLMIGVVACALACCGSRFSNSLAAKDREEEQEANSTSCVVVPAPNTEAYEGDAIQLAVIVQQVKEQPQLVQ